MSQPRPQFQPPPEAQIQPPIQRQNQPYCVPLVDKCCWFITDLKTAAAIIAVLGVATSPALSWAIVRHAYAVKVSCYVSTSDTRNDVVDINLSNVLSLGFGANAGQEPSCFRNLHEGPVKPNLNSSRRSYSSTFESSDASMASGSNYIDTIRWMGWCVLLVDLVFIGFSLHFLVKIFNPPSQMAALRFIVSCIVSGSLSFIYAMSYVGACVSVGGTFPLFECFFCCVDLITWTYFLIVVDSFRRLKSNELT